MGNLDKKVTAKATTVHPYAITNFMQTEFSKSGNDEMEFPKAKAENKAGGDGAVSKYRTPY